MYNSFFTLFLITVSTIDPVADPIMAGGLFAITARWFNQLGQYDRGLRYWGTEEIELSLKTWQCGGRLELIPCSRVTFMLYINYIFIYVWY